MKKCTKCNEIKPEEEFYLSGKREGQRVAQCKCCVKERQRNNRNTEARKEYYQKNKEKISKWKKQYNEDNKELLKERRKEYSNTLNGKYAMYKGSAKARDIPFDLTKEEFSSFWQKPCYYCGDEIETIGLDRIDSKEGYLLTNVVPCCTICNTMKMDRDTKDFINKVEKIYDNTRRKIYDLH